MGVLLFCAVAILNLTQATKICSFIGDWLAYLMVRRSFLESPQQDSLKKKEMKVIICGISRTDTMSMKLAMETLGFTCFHGMHLYKPTNSKLFIKAITCGYAMDWRALLDGYGAIVDFPATCAYKQLLQVYPNAKVILIIQDPYKWYKSFSQTVLDATHGYSHWIWQFLCPCLHKCIKMTLYKKILRGKPDHEESCIDSYKQHIENVREFVEPHKLLVYEVGKDDGWTRLCEFLNAPHPNVPFPLVNDQNPFHASVQKISIVYTVVLISYSVLISFTTMNLLWG